MPFKLFIAVHVCINNSDVCYIYNSNYEQLKIISGYRYRRKIRIMGELSMNTEVPPNGET